MTQLTFADPNAGTVVGIGSALVDILAREEEAFLEKSGAIKGGMTLVDKSEIDRLLALSSAKPVVVPGGSACNTVLGVGKLGAEARFIGKCGHDHMAELFRKGLMDHGVEPCLLPSQSATGQVLSVITPDAQRSMFTYLGAAAEMKPEEMVSSYFEGAAIVHIEGYLVFNPELITAAMKAAKAAGAMVSLDLASHNVVTEARDLVHQLVTSYVDILIANEDEALAYTGHQDEAKALEALCADVTLAALKVGARGSYIRYDNRTVRIDPLGDGTAIDTTGAGDLWAAGLLYGLVKHLPLEKCGQLASQCGYEVCQVIGASIPEEVWQHIKAQMPVKSQ